MYNLTFISIKSLTKWNILKRNNSIWEILFGLENKITGMKLDSTDALTKFIRDGSTFDFIYVDGSHLLLDCYSDLVLAWIILEKNGIIAIDDYTYKVESMLDSPFEAVNHFLKRYEGKYKLLHKGYRVFLQKI
jgi:hypothetical protein